MKIVHATGELYPYVKTGGLADAVGATVEALAGYGHQVAVFLPGYRAVLDSPELTDAERLFSFGVEMGPDLFQGEVRICRPRKNLTLYLVCRDEYFDRRFPYGRPDRDYEDNAERFIFFSKAVVEALVRLGLKPDVVHCHDWQAALIPVLLRIEERRRAVAIAGKTLLTIHNLAFQGVFPRKTFALTNLPDELLQVDGLEFYGQVNLLKGGILFSDCLTTVSPTYAREILTPKFGCGLEGVLALRADDLVSVLNGIDTSIWNPEKDPHLPASYSASKPEGKRVCRRALLRASGFDESFEGPVFGLICRFTEQKGVHLIPETADFFQGDRARLVILGSGAPEYEDIIRELVELRPEAVHASFLQDESLSHLIEAGSDFFLMPSIFEPCGLNQMYSQHYGTVPVVSRVGGLADTVVDLDDPSGLGTGIYFEPDSAEALLAALERAQTLYRDSKRMRATMLRGMKTDFSWNTAVRRYESLYREIL